MPKQKLLIKNGEKTETLLEKLNKLKETLPTSENEGVELEVQLLQESLETTHFFLKWAMENNIGLVSFKLSKGQAAKPQATAPLLETCLSIPELSQSRTQIKFVDGIEDLPEKNRRDYLDLQNKISNNIREHHKAIQSLDPNTPQIIAVTSNLNSTNTVGRKKRNQMHALDVEIEINQQEEQEEEQQEEQQEDQQTDIQEQRQLNLQALLSRNTDRPTHLKKSKEDFLDKERFIEFMHQNDDPEKRNSVLREYEVQDAEFILAQERDKQDQIFKVFWQYIASSSVNTGASKIVAISPKVATLLASNSELFKSGFSLDKIPPPPGFILYEDNKNPKHLILDFSEHQYKLDLIELETQPAANQLYPSSYNSRTNRETTLVGDERQFSGLSADDFHNLSDEKRFKLLSREAKIKLFIDFMKSEDTNFVDAEKEAHLNTMLSQDYFTDSMLYNTNVLVSKYGAKQIYSFLNNLYGMSLKFGNEDINRLGAKTISDIYLQKGALNFIQDFETMVQPEGAKALSDLILLDPGEFELFCVLSNHDYERDPIVSHTPPDFNFITKVKNFMTFREELKKLGIDLSLMPLNMHRTPFHHQNMEVMMQRILTIVQKSINPIEQFQKISDLTLRHDAEYQAMTQDGYYFVSYKMGFGNDRYEKEHFKIETNHIDVTSKNGPTEFQKIASQISFTPKLSNFLYLGRLQHSISTDHDRYCKQLFLRLVGKSINAYEYSEYEKIYDNVSTNVASNQYGIRSHHYALALTAFATIHNKAANIDASLYTEAVDKIQAATNARIHPNQLLSYLKLADNPDVARPQFNELISLIQFHTDLGHEHSWNRESKFLENAAKLGQVYFEVIHNNTIDKRINAKNIALIADILCQDENLDATLISERNNLFKLITLCDIKKFDEEKINNFLTTLKTYNPDNLKLAIHVLSLIKFKDPTKQHPELEDLKSVLATINNLNNPTSSDIIRVIQSQPGFSNCVFESIKTESYSGDAARELVLLYLDEIQAALTELNIPWDDQYAQEPQLLVNQIMSIAKSNPIKRGVLSIASGKLLNMMNAQMEEKIGKFAIQILQVKTPEIILPETETILSILKSKVQISTDVLSLQNSLDKLVQHENEAKAFIDTLGKIQTRSSASYKNTLQILKKEFALHPMSLKTLDDLFKSLLAKDKFPNELIKNILIHPSLKEMTPEKIDTLINNIIIPQVIRLQSDLNKKTLNVLINDVLTLSGQGVDDREITNLLDKLNRGAETKGETLKVIKAIAIHPNPSSELIQNILGLISIAEKDPGLSSKFYSKLAPNVEQLNNIAIFKTQSKLSNEETKNLLLILSKLKFDNEEKEVKDLLLAFSSMQPEARAEFLSTFGSLSLPVSVPYPNSKFIIEAIQSNTPANQIVKSIYDDLEKTRNDPKKLDAIFSTAEVPRVLENIQNLIHNTRINYTTKYRLQQQIHTLNYLGRKALLSTDLNNPHANKKHIKNMDDTDIQRLLEQYRHILQNNPLDKTRKDTRLIYLALLRESMFRTTGRMAYSTQMIAVLNARNQETPTLSEIQTGQGKSMIGAFKAAMLQAEGDTVHIATMNEQLTKDAIEENRDFYNYIGVKTHLMTGQSDFNEHTEGGIYYFDVPSLGLFHGRAAIEGFKLTDKISLVLDEADYTLLDDKTQYRYSANLNPNASNQNIFAFAYPLINNFIDDDSLPDETAENLRRYLLERSDPKYFKILQDKEFLTDKQLNIWLDSATSAKNIFSTQENVKWSLKKETRNNKPISIAKLIINDTPSVAQWSNGIQQFVHARINKQHEKEIKEGTFPLAPIDVEKPALASITSKIIVDFYKKRGTIWGITGTIGSVSEKLEQAAKYGFTLFSIPSHQKGQRKTHKPILVDTDSKKHKTIFNEMLRFTRQKNKIPNLTVCKDPIQAQALCDFVKKEFSKKKYKKRYPLKLQLASGTTMIQYVFNKDGTMTENKLSQDQIKEQAGENGTITISTPILGRGIDFKHAKDSRLEVMQAYIDIERPSRQIEGRSGRQGLAGGYRLILSREDLHRTLDDAKVPYSTSIFKRKKLEKYIQEIQKNRNYTSKEKRQQIEVLGDVRNFYFAQMLELLDKNRNDLDAKTNILKNWESFILNLDLKKAELLNVPQKISIETFALKLLSFSDKAWHQDTQSPLLSAADLHTKATEITTPAHKEQLTSLGDEKTIDLRVEVNLAKLACEGYPPASQILVNEATFKELEIIHNHLLKTFKNNKVSQSLYPEGFNVIDPKWQKQFSELYIALHLAFLKAPKGPKKDQYQTLMAQLNTAIRWHKQFSIDPNEPKAIENLITNVQIQLSDKIKEQKIADQQSPYKKAISFLFNQKTTKTEATPSKPTSDSTKKPPKLV